MPADFVSAIPFLSGQMPGASVQAASVKTMQRAYKKYLKDNVSEKKRFAIAGIGEKGKPVLLIGTVKGADEKIFIAAVMCIITKTAR